MIDFHTHILPRIDDGSRDLGMTEAMLREEGRQGVRLVIATPHFYADEMSIDGFLERRAMAMAETEGVRHKAEETLPAVLAGAEVRYFDGIGAAKEIAALCVEGTETMLLELPVYQWGHGVLKDVEALVEKRKLTVVLAHVERSFPFQRDRSVWDRVMSLPLMPQVNGGGFLKRSGLLRANRRQRFCMSFLADRFDVIVGSDCHNMRDRAPNLKQARAAIAAALGSQTLERTDAAVNRALGR